MYHKRLTQLSLWIAPLFFLGLFFFYPLLSVFKLAGEAILTDGLSGNIRTHVWEPLFFTFWQATLSTVLTLALGLPAAYVFARYKFRGKVMLRAMTTLPFILPTVVTAASFNALLGPRGWINLGLIQLFHLSGAPLQVMNTLGVILLAHVFYNTAVVIRVVGSAWSQLDIRLEHAGRVLGASPLRVLWEVTLPLLRPSILAATLLVFLFDFTSFGVVLMLGGPRFATLEVEIYTQTMHMLNLPLAGLLSGIQIACTLLVMAVYLRLTRRSAVPLKPRLNDGVARSPRRWIERLLVGGMVIILLVLLVSPLAALGLRSISRLDAERGERNLVSKGLTLVFYKELFVNRHNSFFYVPPIAAARNSLLYAGATVCISLVMGFLSAYALRSRSVFNRILSPLIMLPLGTSAVTLGLGFVVVFMRPPIDLRSFPILIPIAHSLVALPVVVQTLQPALAAIPTNLQQAAATLGAAPWRVWWEVDLPILARSALVGAVFAFTISLGEFGATSFLANPQYPTLPLAIYRFLSQPGAMNYGQAMAMATLLVVVCGVSIILIEKIEQ